MNIAKLSERVAFERNSTVIDSNANHLNEWVAFFSCQTSAMATSYQTQEQIKAGVTTSNDGLIFTVRWCSELADLDNTHFRVRFRDEVYNIVSVDQMNYGRRSLKITCERERSGSDVEED